MAEFVRAAAGRNRVRLLRLSTAKWLGRKKPRLVVPPVKHVLSHRVIYADLWAVELPPSQALPPGFISVPAADVKKYAVSRLVQKLLDKANLL